MNTTTIILIIVLIGALWWAYQMQQEVQSIKNQPTIVYPSWGSWWGPSFSRPPIYWRRGYGRRYGRGYRRH